MVDHAGGPVSPGVGIPPGAAAALAGTGAPVVDSERSHQASLVGAAEAAVSSTAGRNGAQAVLPGVLADVPVAVLVIDQGDGTVVYANTAAIELAGRVRLPLPIDTWGASVGLTDLSGAPLASTANPLSHLARAARSPARRYG
ncbi:hypothetical protein A7K94_0213430 [Modestobacter sp. VKM Ac-2676]|nr:hypothetical protein A7K94_0213430 [Modestobacter sp. VKM Ac-2676]